MSCSCNGGGFPPRLYKNSDEQIMCEVLYKLTPEEQKRVMKWAKTRAIVSLPDIGPYSASRAEEITELMLDSKKLYKALEQLLRGDIDILQFGCELQVMAENQEEYLKENQAECLDDDEHGSNPGAA